MSSASVEVTDIVLGLRCPDTAGIVHAVAGFVVEQGGSIVDSQQYGDLDSGAFFMRLEARLATPRRVDDLRSRFESIAIAHDMEWSLTDAHQRPRIAILVSKAGHCLNDLLFRVRTGQLRVDVALVASNHLDLEADSRSQGIDFVHLPVTPETKASTEAALVDELEERDVDFVVLARYMQVLSPELCRQLEVRAINIHHSFLPSFKGARPYTQARSRGVKLVGATSHYVTSELDGGPIIEQEVVRVSHAMDAGALVVAGRDAESLALARAFQWHAERRIFIDGHRTVVFK